MTDLQLPHQKRAIHRCTSETCRTAIRLMLASSQALHLHLWIYSVQTYERRMGLSLFAEGPLTPSVVWRILENRKLPIKTQITNVFGSAAWIHVVRQRPTVGCLTSPGGTLRFILRTIPILPSLLVCVFHPTALWQNAKSACIALKSSTACVLAPNILNSISYTHTRI